MSKYNALWEYVQKKGSPSMKLSFAEIHDIAGIEIDHSFFEIQKGTDSIWVSSWEDFS